MADSVSTHSAQLVADSSRFKAGMKGAEDSLKSFGNVMTRTRERITRTEAALSRQSKTFRRMVSQFRRGGIGGGLNAVQGIFGAANQALDPLVSQINKVRDGQENWADAVANTFDRLTGGSVSAFEKLGQIVGLSTDWNRELEIANKQNSDLEQKLARQERQQAILKRQEEERNKIAEERNRIEQERLERDYARVWTERDAIKSAELQLALVGATAGEAARLRARAAGFTAETERILGDLATRREAAMAELKTPKADVSAAGQSPTLTAAGRAGAALAGTVAAYSAGQASMVEQQNLREQRRHTEYLKRIADRGGSGSAPQERLGTV